MAGTIDRHVERLEFFSDAVFAFTATLLVVSLEVPTDIREFLDRMAAFPGFAVGFLALVLVWARHRAFFRHFGFYDTGVLLANALLLFSVLFVAFPLKWMTNLVLGRLFGLDLGHGAPLEVHDYADVRALFLLFTGGVTAVFASFLLLHAAAWRRREALAPTAAVRAELVHALADNAIATGGGLAGMLLAAAGVGLRYGLPGWILLLLVPIRLLRRRVGR